MTGTEAARRGIALLATSIGGAFLVAVAFVIVFTLSLPASDGAYGSAPFSDPAVFPVMSLGARAAGIVVFPFSLMLLWRSDLVRASVVVLAATLAANMLATPFLLADAIPVLGVVCVAAMAICRWLLPWARQAPAATA